MKTKKAVAFVATLLLAAGLAGADIVTLNDSELSGLGGMWGAEGQVTNVTDVPGDGVEFTVTLGTRDDNTNHWATIGAEDDGTNWSSYDGFGLNFEIISSSADVLVGLFLADKSWDYFRYQPESNYPQLATGDTASLTFDFSDAYGSDDAPATIGSLNPIRAYGFQVINPEGNDAQTVTVKAMQIPEPATMSLLAMGGLVALRRRRRA